MVNHDEFATKADLKTFKDEIIREFRVVSERLMDQIKLLAEGHSGVIQRFDRIDRRFDQVESRLDRIETRLDNIASRLDYIEKKNERQHLETRALINHSSLSRTSA